MTDEPTPIGNPGAEVDSAHQQDQGLWAYRELDLSKLLAVLTKNRQKLGAGSSQTRWRCWSS
jgi:hypothetical protein